MGGGDAAGDKGPGEAATSPAEETVVWSPEVEVCLFHAMLGHKPVGERAPRTCVGAGRAGNGRGRALGGAPSTDPALPAPRRCPFSAPSPRTPAPPPLALQPEPSRRCEPALPHDLYQGQVQPEHRQAGAVQGHLGPPEHHV